MNEQPSEAWLELASGERINCLIEQTGPNQWQGTPVRDIDPDELPGAKGHLDVLPAGGLFKFNLETETQ